MAIKRRPFKVRPKRRLVKRTFKKRNPTAIKKFIPKMQVNEKKYMDNVYTTETITGGGTNRYLLNGNVQGTSHTTRVGNKAMIKNIELNFNFTSQTAVNIKVMLVIDKDPQGAVFSMANLLNAISGSYQPWSLRNSVYGQKFVTIRNFELILNPQITATNVLKKMKKYIKCNLPVQYNGGVAGTIADITTNALYLVFVADGNASVSFSARLRFTDD